MLRGTYHVFDLFVNQMGDRVVDLWEKHALKMCVTAKDGREVMVDALDAVATLRPDGAVAVSLVNKHADEAAEISLPLPSGVEELTLYSIAADSVSAYNDIDAPDHVRISSSKPVPSGGSVTISLPPHSVNVLVMHGMN